MIALGVIAAVWLFGRRFEQKSHRHPRRRRLDRALGGSRRGDRRPAVPRHHRLAPVRDDRSGSSRSGRAASASGAASRSVWPSGCGAPRRRASRCSPRPTPRHRRWPWPRPSGGGATGGTRSCSVGRPTCRGGSRSRPRTGPRATQQFATFHPTFLYESLWNLALCRALLSIDRRFRLRPGRLFAMYVAGYTFARFFIERIRIDPANEFAGLRVNEWVSAIVFLLAAGFLVVDWLRHRPPRRRRGRRRRPEARRGCARGWAGGCDGWGRGSARSGRGRARSGRG